MTTIYVRALHAQETLAAFLAQRVLEDGRQLRRNFMAVCGGGPEEWVPAAPDTPGLSSLEPHHLDQVERLRMRDFS